MVAAILLVLVLAPAGAEAAQARDTAAVAAPHRTRMKGDEKMSRDRRFGAASSAESAVSNLETQAEEIESELAQTPGDEGLLASLTRTRIDAADAMITNGATGSPRGVKEVKQQLATAGAAWSNYLTVAKKPSPGLAILVAPALFRLAELSTHSQEALKNVKVAAAAQRIVAESRPGKNSWSTLAFYDLFAQHYATADEAIEKAETYASTKFERESLEMKFKEIEKAARRFAKLLKPR